VRHHDRTVPGASDTLFRDVLVCGLTSGETSERDRAPWIGELIGHAAENSVRGGRRTGRAAFEASGHFVESVGRCNRHRNGSSHPVDVDRDRIGQINDREYFIARRSRPIT
jgi:hypothetical protein